MKTEDLRHSTQLIGPYDHLSAIDKTTVSCMCPIEVKRRLFTDLFPLRGVTDKYLCRCVYMLDGYMNLHPELSEYSPELREHFLNELLNALIDHLLTLDPEKLLHLTTQPDPDNILNDL